MPFSELGHVFQKLLHPMTTLLRERAKWSYAFLTMCAPQSRVQQFSVKMDRNRVKYVFWPTKRDIQYPIALKVPNCVDIHMSGGSSVEDFLQSLPPIPLLLRTLLPTPHPPTETPNSNPFGAHSPGFRNYWGLPPKPPKMPKYLELKG